MEKVNLQLKAIKNKTIEYNGIEIEVMPFISLSEQTFLIENYIENYFGTPKDILINDTKYHYFEAEIELKYLVTLFKTNINVEDLDNEFFTNIALWKEITDKIENWHDFKNTLERVICDIKQQETLENSVGKIIKDLVEKGYGLLDKLSDLNPEEIKKAGDEGLKLIERLEKSSILNNPADKVAIAENSGLVEVETKVIEKANEIKTRKPRAKKVK
jgi:hypothetical protein